MEMIPTPAQIKAHLDRYVVGQEAAKRTIATAVSSHYRTAAYQGDVRIGKSNLLLLGPTGSGKTFMIQTVARMLEVPFAQTSATAITPPGWAGADPEQCIKDLAAASRRLNSDNKIDWEATKHGIVYIDEVDKLAQQRDGPGQQTSGFTNVSIQQALLKLVEGEVVTISGSPFQTDGVLFIASGAFVGLDARIFLREHKGHMPPGAGKVPMRDTTILKRTTPIDLIQFGLIPEFVGRFPVVTALDPLTSDDLVRILRDVDDSLIQQIRAQFSVTNNDIVFDEGVLRVWAQMAIEQGVGARGLRTLVVKKLEPVMLDLEPDTLIRYTAAGIMRERMSSVAPCEALAYASESNAPLSQEEDT